MIKKLAGTLVAAGVLLTFGAPAAQAAPPEPFTISENVNFNDRRSQFYCHRRSVSVGHIREHARDLRRIRERSSLEFNVLIRVIYICDNGDTFFAQKHVHTVINEDGSDTNTGPITLKGGTGPFTGSAGMVWTSDVERRWHRGPRNHGCAQAQVAAVRGIS